MKVRHGSWDEAAVDQIDAAMLRLGFCSSFEISLEFAGDTLELHSQNITILVGSERQAAQHA